MFGNQDLKGAQKNRTAFFLSSFFDTAKTHTVKADNYSSTKTATVPRIYCFPFQSISSDYLPKAEKYIP